jgi:putative DNA primase/helicase
MSTTTRPQSLAVQTDSIPDKLKAVPRWVGWKWQKKDGKWQKPPINCRTGKKDDITDPESWSTFDHALTYYREHRLAGIGFVLAEDGYCGVDLDDCRDPESGRLEDWAKKIIDELDSYSEVSPSGTGVKVFVRSFLPETSRRAGKIEVYAGQRYFTVTGHRLPNTTSLVQPRQFALLQLYHDLVAGKPSLTDEEVLSEARAAANAPKFVSLWSGDVKDYPSPSEADLALCSILAWWCQGNAAQAERLFGRSELGKREKWEREDYRQGTIRQAVDGLKGFYHRSGTRGNTLLHSSSSSRDNYTPGELDPEQAIQLAIELVKSTAGLPLWQASFRLARRLRGLTDNTPRQFEPAVKAFCEEAGRPFEEFWFSFLNDWKKVRGIEGADALALAVAKAKEEPYPHTPCSPGPLYNTIASVAWHLSRFTRGDFIQLPGERLAPLLDAKKSTVYHVINLLKDDNILACVDENGFSYAKHKAKDYVFVGPVSEEDQTGPPLLKTG